MIRYTDIQGMRKQAWGMDFSSVVQGSADLAANIGTMGAIYLIASSMLTGTLAGWTAAKLSVPSKQDKGTVRKAYDNERLTADLGYIKEKLRDEYNASKAQLGAEGPKAMRVFG